MLLRNTVEFAFIIAVWCGIEMLIGLQASGPILLSLVLLLSFSKTAFFGAENIRQLYDATRCNQAYHRFMLLMLINMTQIVLSFGLDFHCLHQINAASFSVTLENPSRFEILFEFLYYSTLNFTFFGYGDVTPQTVPAKLITMTEILLAFVTVIFLLSDFISLKESLSGPATSDAQNSRQ